MAISFLPGEVVRPDPAAGAGFAIKQLNYDELEALGNVVGAADLISRTPDPQARRIEFKRLLLNDLHKLEGGEVIDQLYTLSQLKTLVEGFIYGHLRLKIFDLRTFRFNVPPHLRYMGVLTDIQGNIFAGTDPDTLFFSAADRVDYTNLQQNNAMSAAGENPGRRLLLVFRQKLEAVGNWNPQYILWMNALDKLFFDQIPPHLMNLDSNRLKSDWQQIGPVCLRISVAANQNPYSYYYLPVYNPGYLNKALIALSGDVTLDQEALQLTVSNIPAGKVTLPEPGGAAGADQLLLGAGNLEVEQTLRQTRIYINYEQLAPRLHPLRAMLTANPNALELISESSPFNFPDVIRVPIQHDGLVAMQGLLGHFDSDYSQFFLNKIRSKGMLKGINFSNNPQPPCLIVNGDAHFFVDNHDAGISYYVEKFGNFEIEEMQLLGYILWSVFDNAAQVSDDRLSIEIRGRKVLYYANGRFEIDQSLQCEFPNQRTKIASLQRLKGVIENPNISKLFIEAVQQWLKVGYGESFQSIKTNHTPIYIGPYKWFVNIL